MSRQNSVSCFTGCSIRPSPCGNEGLFTKEKYCKVGWEIMKSFIHSKTIHVLKVTSFRVKGEKTETIEDENL